MAFFGKIRKSELISLGKELGLDINDGLKVPDIRKMIMGMADYDEEYIKQLVETMVQQREEDVRLEKERIELEKDRIEREAELQKANVQLEKERIESEKRRMEIELEKLKLGVSGSSTAVSNSHSEPQRYYQELQKIIPKFNPKEDEISFYLVVFERQAKKFKLEKQDWVSHLLALLPSDIVQLIYRESEEKCEDYDHVKKLLLRRFKLSAETFRLKFVQHQKTPQSSWRDFSFELSNFFEEWICGVEATDFQKLKDLLIADQMKKRVSHEVREHFVDSWGKLNSPTKLADVLDEYENIRGNKKANTSGNQEKKKFNSGEFYEKKRKFGSTPKYDEKPRSQDSPRGKNNEIFDKRKSLQCYECGSSNHLRPQCPKLRSARNPANVNRIVEGFEDEYLAPYTTIAEVNGHQMPILRDTGASIDVICRKYITPQMYTGESIWVQQPLDEGPVCLPLAQVKISLKSGEVRTKAAVVRSELDKGRYIMGNRTATLLTDAQLKEISIPYVVNAVVTRAQALRNQNKDDCLRKKDSPIKDVKLSEDASALEENIVIQDEIQQPCEPSPDDDADAMQLPPLDETSGELSLLGVDVDYIAKSQSEDPELKPLFECANCSLENERDKKFFIQNKLLMKKQEDHIGEIRKLIVVPKEFRSRIMALCHENTSGHLGVTKTKDRLGRHFFWPKCYKDLEDYVRSCDSCQKAGKPNEKKKAPLKIVPIIQEVFSKLNIDACGPLPTTSNGNRYIITSICLSSKYPDAIPVTDLTSISVTDALLNIFSRTGFPVEIQCDQGTSFVSNLTTEFFEGFGIKVCHSSVHHPQSNPVERFHRTIKRMLRVMCLESGSDWERHLPAALFALRTVTHGSTGFSPAELVHGKQLRTPETLLYEKWTQAEIESSPVTEHVFKLINRLKQCKEMAVQKMEEEQQKRKKWYDKNTIKREFLEGDLVLVLATSRPNKLSVQWLGPGTIEKKISETNYVVRLPGKKERSQVYHINMLKPYYKRSEYVNLLATKSEKGEMDSDLDFPHIESSPNVYNFEDIISESHLNERLNGEETDQLQQLLNKFAKNFSNIPGKTNIVEHDIELTSEKPIMSRPYRSSQRQTEILQAEIQRMLDLRIIEVGESDYTSPMILVEAPGRDPRPCIDYRRLNAITRTMYYPLPNLEDRVETVAAATYISVLDLSKGYWQIPLTPNAQRIAAFVTSFGTYRPLRLPFGLKNAPYFFSKLMSELLKGCEEYAVPYLDDIAVFSNSWNSHLKHLNIVLRKIEAAGLTLKPSKCKFAQDHVLYLGHIVGQGSRRPSETKVKAVMEFPTPKTKTDIRSFLGLSGYYSKYIPNYSVIAAPLTDALKGKEKRGEIKWTKECENSFQNLKNKLVQEPVLYSPNFNNQFIVQTDASHSGVGAVLSQINDEGEEHPVLYLSKKFSENEKKYGTTEKECASIIFAIKKLHYYLDGKKFIIQTDHNPLIWLKRNCSNNQRLMRWALALQPLNFEITHRSGKENKNSDCLSRLTCE